jgi:hypothetical protein
MAQVLVMQRFNDIEFLSTDIVRRELCAVSLMLITLTRQR